jgi:hypothetical protein
MIVATAPAAIEPTTPTVSRDNTIANVYAMSGSASASPAHAVRSAKKASGTEGEPARKPEQHAADGGGALHASVYCQNLSRKLGSHTMLGAYVLPSFPIGVKSKRRRSTAHLAPHGHTHLGEVTTTLKSPSWGQPWKLEFGRRRWLGILQCASAIEQCVRPCGHILGVGPWTARSGAFAQ